MIRIGLLVVSILSIAQAAGAASLSVVPDKITYNVGETITLVVTGDDAGATAYGVFGRLEYSAPLVKNATSSQKTLKGAYGSWISGTLPFSDGPSAYTTAFNQIAPPFNQDTAQNLPGTLATITLIANAAGVVNASWNTNASSGFQLDFFGLTSAPGTSFTILQIYGDGYIPEPGTAALLGLGLIGLASRRRRPHRAR